MSFNLVLGSEDSSWETADGTYSFTSHILTHGPPLLDLHLHVSSENYTTTTRPAYSALLQWPMTWTITPAIHAQAKQRTEHLGLPTLDLHAAGANDPYRSAAGASVIPESLRTTRQSLSGLVKRSETASRFKLEALAARFLKPLESLLGEKQNLMSETEFSSVDCTAFAYLALLLTPQVPQPWLREMIEQRYPGLRNYVDSHKTRCFPGPVNVSDAHRDDQRNPPTGSKDGKEAAQGLPWQKPQPSTLMETVSRFAASAISNPLDVPIIQSGTTTARPGPQATVPLLFGLLGAVSSAGAYLGYAYNEAQRPRHSLSHMGEAGAMLASLDFGAGGAGAAGQRQTVQQEDVTDIVFRRR